MSNTDYLQNRKFRLWPLTGCVAAYTLLTLAIYVFLKNVLPDKEDYFWPSIAFTNAVVFLLYALREIFRPSLANGKVPRPVMIGLLLLVTAISADVGLSGIFGGLYFLAPFMDVC